MTAQTARSQASQVLIVDDSPDTLHLLSKMLADKGYKVRAVTSGVRALEAVDADPPDLILLDIMMPHMNGYEVCRRLKADERTRDIPVIFVSALDATKDKVNAFAVGGADYVTKPFHVGEVWARVETRLAFRALQAKLQERNAQLEREIAGHRRTAEALRSYADRLEIMHELDQSILAAQSPQSIAMAAVGRIRHLVPCQRVIVIEVTETGQTKRLAAESATDLVMRADTDVYREMIGGQPLEGRRVHGIEDLGALDQRFPAQETLYAEGIRSYVVIPLYMQDELLGALHLEATRPRAFTADHVNAAIEVAALLTVAVWQARLYERAQREITERKHAEAALRQQTSELEARNAELDAFAHTVAHDLKNPLATLVGFSSFLRERYADIPAEKLGRRLDVILTSGRKMASIINELLLLASVRKIDEVKIQPLDMGTIVAEARGRLASMIVQSRAQVILPETWPVAVGYGPWVEEVWANYIGNAIKYGGQPPRVELGAVAQETGTVRFWVRDNGPGLTPEQRDRLFVPFERLEQARAEGHGLGLSIVQSIVTKLGGEVGVESGGVPGQGSTFFFTLPRD